MYSNRGRNILDGSAECGHVPRRGRFFSSYFPFGPMCDAIMCLSIKKCSSERKKLIPASISTQNESSLASRGRTAKWWPWKLRISPLSRPPSLPRPPPPPPFAESEWSSSSAEEEEEPKSFPPPLPASRAAPKSPSCQATTRRRNWRRRRRANTDWISPPPSPHSAASAFPPPPPPLSRQSKCWNCWTSPSSTRYRR